MPLVSKTATTDVPATVRDALTELHAYALILEGERQRVERHLARLGGSSEQAGELDGLLRRRAEVAAQLDLLGSMILALRQAADPAGRLL